MKSLFLFIGMISIFSHTSAQTKVIAHRGFWDTESSAENSIAALQKADSIGCYGSEFDVWLTKDEQLVVNHNPIIKGKIIQRTSADKLTKIRLSNGEHLPTLAQYLAHAQPLKVKLILELKPLNTFVRETTAVEKIVEMVRQMGLEDRVEYISFSLHAVKEFIRLAPPHTPVYYLNGDLSPHELQQIGATGPDYHHGVFKKKPQWIAQCKALGLNTNVWTVNKAEDMQRFIDEGVDFITTNNPLLLQQLIRQKQ